MEAPTQQLLEAAQVMANALQTITKDARIRAWLTRHDPMALRQAKRALILAGIDPNPIYNPHAEEEEKA